MPEKNEIKYYLVEATILPEIIIKVAEAKELLETGVAKTVADAARMLGISRSAFYKYKDSVSPFKNMNCSGIVTFHVLLRDKPGVLSLILAVFADCGANILTINQSIPINGVAIVTISAETGDMVLEMPLFMSRLGTVDGVIKIEILAG